ncbi:hypothetical protein [Catalinimonas niigatensis]|uniref:hypothetical protein n=1 Tax=Catalinimonas niigatensis TaxID=1397264 RepID=UPI0026666C26|nr:hypothetical protein [Catalinimonas niigatensis]WPP48247.1 hypothetical protein PZB72_16370 [Catalinimonas niigatensis]
MALADSTKNGELQRHINRKENASLLEEPNPKEAIHFQLDTDQNGKPVVLIHIQDTIGLLTISAHDLMGRSKEVIREHKLGQGFYEFTLPKVPLESLKYWQINTDGQRVISFIR